MALLDHEVKTEPLSAFKADFAADIHSDDDDSHSFKMTGDSAAAEIKATPVASPPLKLKGETEMVPLLPGVGTGQIKREGRSPSPARTMLVNGSLKHQEMTRSDPPKYTSQV